MRNYLLDDIYEEDVKKISAALSELEFQGPIEGIFYLPLPEELLNDEQKEHMGECGPFFMALEVEETSVKVELLVRARNKIRCSCVAYATSEQRNHMMEYIDKFIADLEISY
ncbi:hypothetical protein [Maridesulfovibrio salexigens]|uniref:Uncharacterized protein n=1 Tax=Maridesulfovibrio salexigens (strain ATCC 14822 / DSM 2638 / NCIMB 8403 / VKM B-1763) TaxID=526222 RepID=C6BV56_MARSD|nr:hypothetical protein [Maridesulfovibrio salexigens]ACS80031.1 conserved hypothetical protein [Maridesulfovibrio salexigens DSM 2638]